jgi:hypothetical protein
VIGSSFLKYSKVIVSVMGAWPERNGSSFLQHSKVIGSIHLLS